MKKLHIKDRLQAIPLANYIVFSTITGVSHETLTTCVYAFFGTEIASCAFIKVYKLKQETDTVDFDE